jgi:hypothetical protein
MRVSVTSLLFLLLAGAAGCSDDPSLQAAFEKQMMEDGAAGFEIIHVEENENDGLVLYTSRTDEYPEAGDRPGIRYYERLEGRWRSATGMECGSSGASRLGLMGNGYLFCSTLKENRDFERIRVGDSEARMFQTGDGKRVWYAIVDDMESNVTGITSDGAEFPLN